METEPGRTVEINGKVYVAVDDTRSQKCLCYLCAFHCSDTCDGMSCAPYSRTDGKWVHYVQITDPKPFVYTDWEQRRYEVARKLFCDSHPNGIDCKEAARKAVSIADALIDELKKGQQQ